MQEDAIPSIHAPNVDLAMTLIVEIEVSTEDDTFRVLARPNIEQMVELHFHWKKKITDKDKIFNSSLNISFMKYYGWTWLEFLRAKKDAGYST